MISDKKKIVLIVGPTGVGKSTTAIELAARLGGEIINADAMQVYRYMDIGTAKPNRSDRQKVPHHLLDIVNPDEPFNASLFAKLAAEKILEIEARRRPVFVVGGTGLYIKALTRGLFPGPGADPGLREQYRAKVERFGLDVLYRELQEKDVEAARRIHPHDIVRIIRALEILELSGESITKKQGEHGFREEPYATLKIGLDIDRQALYERINARCAEMVSGGLVEEVKNLLAMGYNENLKPMQSLGYKQAVEYIQGTCDLETALDEMRQQTRHYAKRQMTWFRADKEIAWHRPDSLGDILSKIEAFYTGKKDFPAFEKA